jgi:predicted porin
MKKSVMTLAGLAVALQAQAATSMFGEADANFMLVNTEAGSFASITGFGSEFGFKGTQKINETEEAFFRMGYQAELTGARIWPAMSEGRVGLRGNYGEIAIFYGETPLSALNNEYFLIDNTPDSIFRILGVNQANNVGVVAGEALVGTASMLDGLSFTSSELEGGIQLEAALIPAEAVDGETGFSFAAHYRADQFRLSGAFEINGEQPNTSLFRVNGDVKNGSMTVGGSLQLGSNSAADTSAMHLAGYVKMPVNFSGTKSDMKVLGAFNTATDAAETTTQEFYLSYVQNIQLTSKVSTYGFVSLYLSDDMQTTNTQGGGGLKVRF